MLVYLVASLSLQAKSYRVVNNKLFESAVKDELTGLYNRLSTDDFNIIQMDPNEKNQERGYNEKISKWLHDFGTSGQVHKEDIESYLSKTSLEYMRNYFNSGSKELSIQYRRLIEDRFYKVLMEIKSSKEYSNDNQICFLYVKNIDK